MSSTYNPATKRAGSRLQKKQKQQMVKQTGIVVGISIVMVLIFFFVIFPTLLNVIFKDSDGVSFGTEDTLPPQVPQIAAPVPATFSGQITLTGYGEPESEIVFIRNGEELLRIEADAEGQFNQEVELVDGENSFTTYAVDAAGNESNVSQRYNVILDTEQPTLELETPEDGQQVELRKNQNITIKGTTEPNARVMINGRLTLANSEGGFSTSYQLQEGENKINFEITDKAGNTYQQEITVSFRF